MNEHACFPVKLRALRKERGFDKAVSFAKVLGVSLSTVTRLERGERQPTLALLCRIAEVLNCTTDELLRESMAIRARNLSDADREHFERLRLKLMELSELLSDDAEAHNYDVLVDFNDWLERLIARVRRRVQDKQRHAGPVRGPLSQNAEI